MNRYSFIFLSIILIAYTAIATSNINKPFLHHTESNLAHYGILARNLITYGADNTNFAPLNISGPIEYYDYKKYYKPDHPFLPTFIISGMYRIFGVSEWATRLPFIIFALAGIVVFYLMAKKLLDVKKALLATAIFAFNPMYGYMSAAAIAQSAVLLFTLIVFNFYLRFLEKKLKVDLVLVLTSLFIACNMDWPGYWAGATLFVYHFFVEKRRLGAFIFIIANIAFFGLHILHVYLLDTANLYPLQKLLFAGGSRSFSDLPGFFTYTKGEIRELAIYFTLPIIFLSFIWLIKFLKGNKTSSEWFILCTLFLALDEVFFVNLANSHDYLTYSLAPFFSLVAVSAFFSVWDFKKGIAIILMALFAVQSAYILYNRYTRKGAYEIYYKMAQAMEKHTDYKDKIMILIDNLHYYTPFYADRYYTTYDANKSELLETNVSPTVTKNTEEFKNFLLKNENGFKYVVTTTKKLAHQNIEFLKDANDETIKKFNIEVGESELFSFLEKNYSSETYDGFIFFKLK